MLKETFKMRKIGKHLVNVSMLSLAVAPVIGSAMTPVTVLAAEYKSGQDGSNKLEFTTKSSTSSTSTTAHEPMDLIQIIDLSGSLSEGEFKSRIGYSGARRQQLMDMIYVIQNKLTDQDHVMLAFYGTNNRTSYETNGQDGAAATKLLSKSEALDILKQLVNTNEVMEMSQSWTLIPNIVVPMLGDKVIRTTERKGFEQVYEEQPNRNKVVSALQFTDDWVADETIDSSFAEWAKKNAKTFMTVVDGVGGSVEKMKAAGHPNIMTYGLTDHNKAGRSEEIAKHFESTATVTKTTTTKQKAHVSITPDAGVTLKTAELVDSTGKKTPLEIKDNKVSADLNDLADGKYVVNYTFGGTVESAKKIVSSVSVDGKEVDKKEDTIQPVAKPTKRIEKIPFKTETKEDPTLPAGEKKVVQKGVEGEKEIITTTSSESESTRTPVDVIVPYDVSGSTYGGVSELDHLEAVAKQGADDTRYLIIGYDEGNTPDGFALRKVIKGETDSETKKSGAKISKVTRFLSKQEVLTFVKKVRELLPASHQDGSWSWDKAMKALKYYDPQYMEEDGTSKDIGTPYEEIFEKGRDKNKAVGILWFTDDWEGWEKYDTSFFEWAQKNHAAQFLTVVYGGTNALSYNTLSKAGQKEILTTSGKDQTALAKEIADKFTQMVTIKKEGKPITSEKVIKEPVNEIIHIGTKGSKSEVTEKKVPFETIRKDDPTLEEGQEKVLQEGVEGVIKVTTVYETQKGEKVKGSEKVTETEAVKKVDKIIAVGTKGVKSDVTEKKVPFETIRKDDPTLEEGQEKVLQEGVEGLIKVTTTYETQKGKKVDGSEKVTEEKVTDKVDKIIAVGTKGFKSEVTEKKVPFETIYKQDPTLKKGEEKVLQEGVEGLIKVTTTYETQKGQKVDGSEKVTEETVTEKVDKIVAQGTMEKRKVRYRVVDSKGQELVKQTDVMEAYQDEEYKVETPKLDGYRLELAKDSVPATGKVADRDVLVTFVAVKIGKPVTLKFVDESGTEIAQKKVLTGEKVEVDTEFSGEAAATIEKDGVKYAFVGIKQTGSKERKVTGKVTDKEQVIEAVYAKPKELPKTSEQTKQRNTVIVTLLSVVGLGGLVSYFGLRKRDEK